MSHSSRNSWLKTQTKKAPQVAIVLSTVYYILVHIIKT